MAILDVALVWTVVHHVADVGDDLWLNIFVPRLRQGLGKKLSFLLGSLQVFFSLDGQQGNFTCLFFS